MLCILLGRIDGLQNVNAINVLVSELPRCVPSLSPSCFWLETERGLLSFQLGEDSTELEHQYLGPAVECGKM